MNSVTRTDLTVKAMGAELTAAVGLNYWASFAGTKEKAHIAGDIAEQEVNPGIKALRQNGLEVVALHHMLGDGMTRARSSCTTMAMGKQTQAMKHLFFVPGIDTLYGVIFYKLCLNCKIHFYSFFHL